jgi:hypothetical protein
MYTESRLNDYINNKGLTPGTILWSSEVDLAEESVRSGAKK